VRVGQEMSERITANRSILSFNNLQEDDLGEYSCVAINDAGSTNLIINFQQKNKKIRYLIRQHAKKIKLKLKSENKIGFPKSKIYYEKNSKLYSQNRGIVLSGNMEKYTNEANAQILKYTSIPSVFSIKYLSNDFDTTKELEHGVLLFNFPKNFHSILKLSEPLEITCKTTGNKIF
jgi:hypothetical protein